MSHPAGTPDEWPQPPAPYSLPAHPPQPSAYGTRPPVYAPEPQGYPPGSVEVSGYPQAPMSGVPMSGAPYLTPPPSPGRGTGGVAAIVLSVVSVLLLIAAAVMTVLYVQKSGELTSANRAHRSTLADRDSQIKQFQGDAKAKQDELDRTSQDLTGAQNQTKDLKQQKETIRQCIQLLAEANVAEQKGDLATAKAKNDQATPICEKAFTYLQ